MVFPKSKIQVQIIDGSNKHITCGIIDEHSHIAISRGVNESSQSVTAEVSIGDVINPNDHNIYRQLSGGVTAVQLLHGSANPIGGQSALIKLRCGSSAEDMKIDGADNSENYKLISRGEDWTGFNNLVVEVSSVVKNLLPAFEQFCQNARYSSLPQLLPLINLYS